MDGACEDEDEEEEEEEDDDSFIDRSTILFFAPVVAAVWLPLVVDDDDDEDGKVVCSWVSVCSSRIADNKEAGDKEVLPVATKADRSERNR